MDLGKWATVIEQEQHEDVQQAAQSAAEMGRETYAQIVMDAASQMFTSDEFWYLVQSLVVGNIAVGAKPEVKMREDGMVFTLTVGFEDEE